MNWSYYPHLNLFCFSILGAPVTAHNEGHFVAGQKVDDSIPGLARSNAKSFLRAGSTATLVDSSPPKTFFQDAQSRSNLTLSPLSRASWTLPEHLCWWWRRGAIMRVRSLPTSEALSLPRRRAQRSRMLTTTGLKDGGWVWNMNTTCSKLWGLQEKSICMHQPLICLFLIRLFLQGAPLCEVQEGLCGDHEAVWNKGWKWLVWI